MELKFEATANIALPAFEAPDVKSRVPSVFASTRAVEA